MIETAEEAAEAVIAVLTRRGWCQGDGQWDIGPLCLSQAFMLAVNETRCTTRGNWTEPWRTLWEEVTKLVGTDLSVTCTPWNDHIYKWNDQPGRSLEDVHLLLKKAAISAAVKMLVDEAPPLTDEQRDKLSLLLNVRH